jgi:hypothetical protein
MRDPKNIVIGVGCLILVLAPVAGIVLYPKANWVLAFIVLGIALIALASLTRKDPSPEEVAQRAERLLNGTSAGWDVDDYEHLRPREPHLRELWQRTLALGGLPEEWVRLDDERKRELQSVICAIRQLASG